MLELEKKMSEDLGLTDIDYDKIKADREKQQKLMAKQANQQMQVTAQTGMGGNSLLPGGGPGGQAGAPGGAAGGAGSGQQKQKPLVPAGASAGQAAKTPAPGGAGQSAGSRSGGSSRSGASQKPRGGAGSSGGSGS
jgi:hypothetical protein